MNDYEVRLWRSFLFWCDLDADREREREREKERKRKKKKEEEREREREIVAVNFFSYQFCANYLFIIIRFEFLPI